MVVERQLVRALRFVERRDSVGGDEECRGLQGGKRRRKRMWWDWVASDMEAVY
jgi:hypothetical protein